MKNRWQLIVITILSCILVFSLIFYIRSSRPMREAKNDTIRYAEKYADLKDVERFYWFTREKTYFSVTGTDKEGKKIVVIIPKSGDKVVVKNQSEGLTQEEAVQEVKEKYSPNNILKINLGMFKEQIVWEVTAQNKQKQLSYYLISFSTGDEVKTIKNL